MREALAEALQAAEQGEVPVGAVVVRDGEVVGRGYNQPIAAHDATAHAEVVALRAAGQRLGNYRLANTTLYVTVEPCMMCVGALSHARVAEVVFGAPEPRMGSLVYTLQGLESAGLHHRFEVTAGVLEAECRELIQEFFRARR